MTYTITPTWAECERAGKLLADSEGKYDVGRANEIACELAKARLLGHAAAEMLSGLRSAVRNKYDVRAQLSLSVLALRLERALEATR